MNVAFKKNPPTTHALDALADALSLPSGIEGVYARTAAFEDIVTRLGDLISRQREEGTEVLRFPPVMSRRQLERSGYLKSFPHFLGCVCCLSGSEAEVRGTVERFEAGEAWTDALDAADRSVPLSCCVVHVCLTHPFGSRFAARSAHSRASRSTLGRGDGEPGAAAKFPTPVPK